MMLMALTAGLYSCSDDDDLDSVSVFDKISVEEKNEFDNWLEENYRKVYNIDYKYRYSDNESDLSYNVIPAEFDKAKALAILVKHVWLEAYTEAISADFMKTYTPRIIQLTGSYKWNSNGSQVMGTAEGGLKIMFYGVNELDIDNPRINTTNPYESRNVKPIDMNYWFFHTMHHEFLHILQQTKSYPTEFNTISAGKYHANDWINVEDEEAPLEGFVTGYASGEAREDMAEIYATYVTHTPEAWEKILKAGEKGSDKTGREAIEKKLEIIKKYMKESWGFELDDLRTVVLRRSHEVLEMDLRTLD